MLENNSDVNKNVTMKNLIINNWFFSLEFSDIYYFVRRDMIGLFTTELFSSVKEERRIIEIASVVAEMRSLLCTLWRAMMLSLHWTSRRGPTTAVGNSYYFIRLIRESALVDAHQWTETGINRRTGERKDKWEEEMERRVLFPE